MITHSYKNISQDEKILLYVELLKYIRKEDVKDEERGYICKTEYREKRQSEH